MSCPACGSGEFHCIAVEPPCFNRCDDCGERWGGDPSCRYCGADCSQGRSWDGGDLYACPACADPQEPPMKPYCRHEPSILSHYRDWEAWTARNVVAECNYGNCTMSLCQSCGRITGSWGLLECPCDNTRGWRARFLEQMGEPPAPVKPTGRYRHRIERRRRELREHQAWVARWSAP